jgi:transposase
MTAQRRNNTKNNKKEKLITKNHRMRKLIVEKKNNNLMTPAEIATELKIPRTTVASICKKFDETGEYEVSAQSGRPSIWTDEMKKFVDDKVTESDGTITLERLKESISGRFNNVKTPGISAICNYLNVEARLVMKRVTTIEDQRNADAAIRKRQVYCKSLLTESIEYDRNCIFVDEAGFNVNMVRGRARAKPNQPAAVHTESKRGTNISIIMAISNHGLEMCDVKIVNAGTTGTIFNEFMMKLVKKVDESSSWDTNGPYYFVMDNVKFHYNLELKDYIERSPHQLKFLPPYSPFLNPIEEAFSKLKWFVKLQHFERGKDKLIDKMKEGTEHITTSDCQGWVRHAMSFFVPCIEGQKDL